MNYEMQYKEKGYYSNIENSMNTAGYYVFFSMNFENQ